MALLEWKLSLGRAYFMCFLSLLPGIIWETLQKWKSVCGTNPIMVVGGLKGKKKNLVESSGVGRLEKHKDPKETQKK